jgi:hypothetical protein
MYRDKSASALLTLEKKEKVVDELNAELEERDAFFNEEIQKLTNQYNQELEAVKAERDEYQEVEISVFDEIICSLWKPLIWFIPLEMARY